MTDTTDAIYDVLAAYTGLSDARNHDIAVRVADAISAHIEAREAAAAAEVERLRKALRQIRDLGLGPDRGSAQWQIGAANEIARAALTGEGR